MQCLLSLRYWKDASTLHALSCMLYLSSLSEVHITYRALRSRVARYFAPNSSLKLNWRRGRPCPAPMLPVAAEKGLSCVTPSLRSHRTAPPRLHGKKIDGRLHILWRSLRGILLLLCRWTRQCVVKGADREEASDRHANQWHKNGERIDSLALLKLLGGHDCARVLPPSRQHSTQQSHSNSEF